jgi:hypothetical protein
MQWLKRVFVRVLLVRDLLGIARPTPPAGPVSPEPTTPLGNSPSVPLTSHQRLPASLPQSLSNGHALLTSTEQKPGSRTLSALLELLRQARGSKSRIPARQRLQLAKQVSKHVKNLALQIRAVAKRTPAKAPAQTPTASQSGGSGN